MELVGSWVLRDGKMQSDGIEDEIAALIDQHLTLLASSADGWSSLYRDERDGSLLELTFPNSERHGGGPRKLGSISMSDAAKKFDHSF